MKKNLFISGLFLCAMTLGVWSCGDDDKENEIVPDPLVTEKEYFISGTVSDANGALSGATVSVNDQNATTDTQGIYNLTVKETRNYTVKFSASGKQNYEQQVSIASDAANRTNVTLNVKMAKAIDMSAGETEEVKKDEETNVKVIANENTEETPAAEINIPAGAAEEGTKVTAVSYEQTQAETVEEEANTATKAEDFSMMNIAIQTEPANAVAQEDITIAIENETDDELDTAFDPEYITLTKEDATTRGYTLPPVRYIDKRYLLVLPKGTNLTGTITTKTAYERKGFPVKTEGMNSINGKKEILCIENREYEAATYTLDIETSYGWDFTESPEEALKAIGGSPSFAKTIRKTIRGILGRSEGYYVIKRQSKAVISGNHVLYYGSHCKVQDYRYQFHLIVNRKSVNLIVPVRQYVGAEEVYTSGPISQHSGGTGN